RSCTRVRPRSSAGSSVVASGWRSDVSGWRSDVSARDDAAVAARREWDRRFEGHVVDAGSGRRFARDEHDLVALLNARAEERPDAPFVTDGVSGDSLTYRGFLDRAGALAGLLAEHGFGPGDRLVVIEPPSPEAVVAMFAAMLAGGVAVPLNE